LPFLLTVSLKSLPILSKAFPFAHFLPDTSPFEYIVYIFILVLFRWSEIAKRLPGRTAAQIKNYWHSTLRANVSKYSLPAPEEQLHGSPIPPSPHSYPYTTSPCRSRLLIGEDKDIMIGSSRRSLAWPIRMGVPYSNGRNSSAVPRISPTRIFMNAQSFE